MHVGDVFADAESVSLELDGRACKDLVQALLGTAKAHPGDTDIGVDVNFTVAATDDADVTGDIAELKTDGAGNIKLAVETARYGWAHIAARESDDHTEQRDGYGQPVMSRHTSSSASCSAYLAF